VSDDRRQVVTGTIGASAAEVFAVLADPSRHTEVDGAGMLRGAPAGQSPITTHTYDWSRVSMVLVTSVMVALLCRDGSCSPPCSRRGAKSITCRVTLAPARPVSGGIT
jgi:hypothetical protein